MPRERMVSGVVSLVVWLCHWAFLHGSVHGSLGVEFAPASDASNKLDCRSVASVVVLACKWR
eukprot:1221417-Heterocapsa_arctica.AAC.1